MSSHKNQSSSVLCSHRIACIWNSQFTGCCSKWQIIKLAFFWNKFQKGHESSWSHKSLVGLKLMGFRSSHAWTVFESRRKQWWLINSAHPQNLIPGRISLDVVITSTILAANVTVPYLHNGVLFYPSAICWIWNGSAVPLRSESREESKCPINKKTVIFG